jgi:hypothetical protein
MSEEERKGGGGGGDDGAAAAARAAEQARELQDAAAALLTRTRAEEEALRRRAAALQGELRRLREAAAAHADSEKVRCSQLILPTLRARALCVCPLARACLPNPRVTAPGGGCVSVPGDA